MGNVIKSRGDCYSDGMDPTETPTQAGPGIPDPDETVTFIELAGDAARDTLGAYGAAVARAGAACELLASETQPDLFLLVCRAMRGDGRQAARDIPADARQWSFRRIESFR